MDRARREQVLPAGDLPPDLRFDRSAVEQPNIDPLPGDDLGRDFVSAALFRLKCRQQRRQFAPFVHRDGSGEIHDAALGLSELVPKVLDVARDRGRLQFLEHAIDDGQDDRRPEDLAAELGQHRVIEALDRHARGVAAHRRSALVIGETAVHVWLPAAVAPADDSDAPAAYGTPGEPRQ